MPTNARHRVVIEWGDHFFGKLDHVEFTNHLDWRNNALWGSMNNGSRVGSRENNRHSMVALGSMNEWTMYNRTMMVILMVDKVGRDKIGEHDRRVVELSGFDIREIGRI